MIRLLPGTTIECDINRRGAAEELIQSIFIMDGLVLSQVCQLTGLEPHIVQNWVRRGFLSPPVQKKYSKRQFFRIVIINFLKASMQIEMAVKLMEHINFSTYDEADDLIDDSVLYLYFLDLLRTVGKDATEEKIVQAAKHIVLNFTEDETIRRRLSDVLIVMCLAYTVSEIQDKIEIRLNLLTNYIEI